MLGRLPIPSSERLVLPPGVTMGRHSYGYGADTFQLFRPGARVEVGAFCSIAREVCVLAGSEHFTGRASTFPFNARIFDPDKGHLEEAIDSGPTVIGSDVWIGTRALILSGVMVGDGAVIGAGAVISKHVPAYAVVVGNPAEVVHYRFGAELRERLLALRWWDWDDDEIARIRHWFAADVEAFVTEMERTHERPPQSELARRLAEAEPAQMTSNRRPSPP